MDDQYRVWEDKVMKVECFLDLFRPECAACGKKIRGRAEVFDGKQYCPGCYQEAKKAAEIEKKEAQEAQILLQVARENATRQLGAALQLMAELEKKARQFVHEREQQRQEEMADVEAEVEAQGARRKVLEDDARRRAYEEEQKRIADEEEAEARKLLWEAEQMFAEENEDRVQMEVFARKEMSRLQKKATALAFERSQEQQNDLETLRLDREELDIQNITLVAAKAEAERLAKEDTMAMENLVSSAYDTSFSLEQLSSGDIPDHIDRREKERHLTDDIFFKLFKMTKDDFYKMQLWKRNKLKKQVGLY